MKHTLATLEGALLDLAVARAEDLHPIPGQPAGYFYWTEHGSPASGWFTPTTRWEHGGPIIERERIKVEPDLGGGWIAAGTEPASHDCWGTGSTPLIAAMRAYVASRFGEEVELP